MPGANQTPEHDRRGISPLPGGGAVPLGELLPYAREVLAEVARNRDIRSEAGEPCVSVRSSGEDGEASWLHLTADFSGVGMAVDMPLVVTAYAAEPWVEWNFGVTLIAKTPRSATPQEAADALSMDVLLDGFRRFVAAESVLFPTSLTRDAGRGKGPVPVDRQDCICGECGGSLEVVEVDDATMSVECENGHAYELEHDAFDAGFDYVLEFLSRKGRG